MNIFYLISLFLLYTTSLLIKKREDKLNLIVQIVLHFVYLIMFNVFISWCMTLLHIPITLLTMTIVNVLISVVFSYQIFKKDKKQLFEVDKRQMIFFCIIVLFGIGVCLYNFNFQFGLSYETTDPNVHYFSAYAFYKNDALLSQASVHYPIYGAFSTMMPISYANIGMLFKAFAPIVGEFNLYKVFIVYDCFMYILSISVFYAMIISVFKNKKMYFIGMLLVFFFALGYPLSNLQFGFRYLGDTVIVIMILVIIMREFHDNYINFKKFEKGIILSILFLINFNIFFGYYMFVPFTYGALFLYLIWFSYKNKMLFKKEYFLINFLIFALPCAFGIVYFFTPLMKSALVMGLPKGASSTIFDTLKIEGYIYRDLYSNFIFFVPFVIFYFYKKIKTKDIDFDFILIVILLIFILLLFIMGMFNKASSYYYFKNYFVLWFLIFYITAIVINQSLIQKVPEFLNILATTILLFFTMFIVNFDYRVSARNPLYNVDQKMIKYFDIYATNKVLSAHSSQINGSQMETLHIYQNSLKKGDYKDVAVDGDTIQRLWFFCLTRDYPNKTNDNTFSPFYASSYTIDEYVDSDLKTLVGFRKLSNKDKMKLEDKPYTIIFENKDAFIIERD